MYNDLPDCVRIDTIANNRKELKFINHSRIIVCTCGSKDNARGAIGMIVAWLKEFENRQAE